LPLFAVTVITYDPDGVVEAVDTVRVEVPIPPAERVIVVGLKDDDGPLGETPLEMLTVPVNPPRLVRLTVEVVDVPGVNARPFGFAET
jgi:hypothetical protein